MTRDIALVGSVLALVAVGVWLSVTSPAAERPNVPLHICTANNPRC